MRSVCSHLRHLPALAAIVVAAAALAPAQAIQSGAVITRSQRASRGAYTLASADLDHPALTIRGSNLTLDFTGVTLGGGPDDADPDTFHGLGVLVDGGDNITIRNLTVRGYKVGILARGTKHLHISGVDASYNWKARLYSLVEHESLLDWLSYHHNEKEEWLAGGAGIYLADTDGAEIDHSTVVQGQNGLMLVRSNGAKVWGNTFSYLSGIGIGLYRSSHNTIQQNRVDYCVRGYSEGFYNRGQDSAGILVYEQSSHNTFAYNSVTHGGDGFFLWAGQTTMDTGEGGANDNLVYGNDFSFAPTNGIEATFSRNAFIDNRVEGNWHGIWGGYSYDTDILHNRFAKNTEAIAIEHGQQNRIERNTFDGDQTAIHLWQNLSAPDPAWGYPKHHDTRSRDYLIRQNTFTDTPIAVKVERSSTIDIDTNQYDRVGTPLAQTDSTDVGPLAHSPALVERASEIPARIPGIDALMPDSERRGRDSIIVDEWGPYDWKSPKLWPAGRTDTIPLKLRVLGPPGTWTVKQVRGAEVTPRSGSVPGEITVRYPAGVIQDVDVELTYVGAAVVSPRGEHVAAGAPCVFSYHRYFVPIDWTVQYRAWSDPQNVFAQAPIREERRDRLDFESGRAIADGVPADRVSVRATGIVELPPGAYELRTISDDGIRVWVDGTLAIDDWAAHESKLDRTPIAPGRHTLKVEYYEVEGFAELRLDVVKR